MSTEKSKVLIKYNEFRVRYHKLSTRDEDDFNTVEPRILPFDEEPDESQSSGGEEEGYAEVRDETEIKMDIYHVKGKRSETGIKCR